jgi:glutaconate CoA-transferase subunit B
MTEREMLDREDRGPAFTSDEMMSVVIARQIRDGETVATGANSPIPAAGCLLATAMHAPAARVIILGSRTHYPFTSGKEFFDFAQRGRLDLFFLGGIQIDAEANINLHVVGDYARPRRRFPGAFGSGVLYFAAKRVILFRTEHTRRLFVPHVDFITSPGSSGEDVRRPGGPDKVVTPLALLAFNRDRRWLELESVHPGHTIDEVVENTGFDLPVPPGAGRTPPPSEQELALLRGPVMDTLAPIYPGFVEHARARLLVRAGGRHRDGDRPRPPARGAHGGGGGAGAAGAGRL